MIHNFGPLSYQFDIETMTSEQNQPYIFFQGGDCDETKIMLQYWKIKEGDIVIDVGAHIGSWTLPTLAQGASYVYAFEPNRECTSLLKKNLKMNGWLDKVDIIDKALWHKYEKRLFYEDELSVIQPNVYRYENCVEYEVECVPLDSYSFERIDWIKIDVEGAELAVLIGARNTLLKHKPKMIIEVHEKPIRKIISDFTVDMLKNWLPPSKIIKIDDEAETPRFLVSLDKIA